MKSDEALKHDVEQELLWDSAIDARNIDVTVHGRVVTLEGSVSSYAQKLAAQKATRRVADSRAVVLELVVRLPSPSKHTDEELARAVMSILKWQDGVPENAIQVVVEHGCVTLSGQVDHGYQRQSAETAVSRMRGVVGLSNQITVRGAEVATDIHTQIAGALARRAQRESARVNVNVHDGVVRLTGTVDSLAEKRAACGVAWAAKGVRWVVDELCVN
ncbi:BON domain-containing protein [Paraburkholderia nemoris]|uniref:BON domain-containing protein n=1 Tax=Paraburkholderia nemoris TaxID=2793076 RepID=UPI0038B7DF29